MNTRKSKLVGTKKPLVKANYGRISKDSKPMDQPKPNPYGSKDKPVNKDVPSVSPQNLMSPPHWAAQSGSGKAPNTPMDVIKKTTKKPGKVGQLINKVKSNIQERQTEREKLKDYKKKVKANNNMSPYTTGASFKDGGFLDKIKERKEERKRAKEYSKNPKMTSFKTGGMVNSNARVLADKTPGSKGTKVGLNKRVPKPGKKC